MKRGGGTQAVTLAPQSAGAHYAMGQALERVGRKTQAQTCYRTAAKLDPRMRRLLYDVAALSEDPNCTGGFAARVRCWASSENTHRRSKSISSGS
jgi:hypothetical protein